MAEHPIAGDWPPTRSVKIQEHVWGRAELSPVIDKTGHADTQESDREPWGSKYRSWCIMGAEFWWMANLCRLRYDWRQSSCFEQ